MDSLPECEDTLSQPCLNAKSSMNTSLKFLLFFLFFAQISSAYGAPLPSAYGSPLHLTSEQQAFLDAHPVIRVGNEVDWPPYDFVEQGRSAGFAIDQIRLLAQHLGLTIEFVNGYTWSQLLELFQEKKIDVMPAMYRNAARETYTAFTKPYTNSNLVVVVHQETNTVRSIEDLAGKKVAIQRDDGFIPSIEDRVGRKNIVFFTSYLDALIAVSTGKVDACIGSSLMTNYLVNKEQILGLKVIDYIIRDRHQKSTSLLHIGVRNDWRILRDILDQTLSTLPQDEQERLQLRWFYTILPDEHATTRKMMLTSREKEYLQEKKTIRISVDPDWLPFEQIDDEGVYNGLGAELVRTMSRRLGVRIVLIPTETWKESLEKSKNGECDMLPVAMDVPSRRIYLDFTRSYLDLPFVLATRTDSAFIQDTADIIDKTVGMVTSYGQTEVFKIKYPNLRIVEVENAADGLQRVHNGELFGYIDSLPAIGYQMQKESLVDLKIAGTLDIHLKLSMATCKDDPLLGGIAQKFIDSIEDSEMRAMFNTWLVVTPPHRTDYTLVWQILGISVLLLLGFYLWNRRLVRLNQKLAQAHRALDIQASELKRLSRTDALTQLPNRGRLDEVFSHEIERCRRFGRTFSVILMDIDQFKQMNDKYGHQAGDTILVELARLLKDTCRKSDTIGRWGGEEFLLICPELTTDNLPLVAEKMRRTIAAHSFPVDSRQTCSFGAATYQEGDDASSLLKHADDALYRAKEKGRNRVEHHFGNAAKDIYLKDAHLSDE